MDIKDIKRVILKNKGQLKRDHKVHRIGVFGSYVKNEYTENSDIDCLVDLGSGVDLFDIVDLQNKLSSLLWNKKIDLVMRKTLKPRIKDKILREVEWI